MTSADQPFELPEEARSLASIALDYVSADRHLFGLTIEEMPEAAKTDASNFEFIGAPELAPLLHRKVMLYLTDASEMLRGIAAMMLAGLGGSCSPLARSVAERSGRVNWLLEADLADSRRRAARVALEHARGLEHYRETISRLGAKKEAKAQSTELRKWRASIEEWFPDQIVKPPADPCDAMTLSKVASTWTVAGETLPGFNAEQAWLTDGGDGNTKIAIAAYSALCGLAHPNDHFLIEHLAPAESGVAFEYSWVYTDKLLRAAASGYTSALKHAVSYWGDDADLVAELDATADRHDKLTADLNEAADQT